MGFGRTSHLPAGPHVDATPAGRKSALPVVFTLIQQWEIHSRGTVKGILSSHAVFAKSQRWGRGGDCLKGVTIAGSGKQKYGSLKTFHLIQVKSVSLFTFDGEIKPATI